LERLKERQRLAQREESERLAQLEEGKRKQHQAAAREVLERYGSQSLKKVWSDLLNNEDEIALKEWWHGLGDEQRELYADPEFQVWYDENHVRLDLD
jgi:hypothetical protein